MRKESILKEGLERRKRKRKWEETMWNAGQHQGKEIFGYEKVGYGLPIKVEEGELLTISACDDSPGSLSI